MTSIYYYLTEGPRIFLSSWKSRLHPKKYQGNAKKICQEVVEDCWGGKYFRTSSQNFAQFWSRDFGWCTKSLMQLGYKDKVHKTIRYALNAFQDAKKVATTITPKGKAFDFPTYAVDSLPWLIHSITQSKFNYENFIPLLNKEISKFHNLVVDPKTRLVISNKHFSSMKDFSIRESSCYDNCMLIMLITDLQELNERNHHMKLSIPFYTKQTKKQTKLFYSNLLKSEFWNGQYFFDDMQKKEYFASDANVFPILLGLINDKDIIQKIISKIKEEELDDPLPLKYAQKTDKIKFIWQELVFFQDYESDSIWTHMGPLWVKTLKHHNKDLAEKYKAAYTKLIETGQCFPEVLHPNGKLYTTPFYSCDRSMLWAANYLTL